MKTAKQLKALHLTDVQVTAIMQHVNTQAPHEACGLLGGVGGVVKKVYPIPNVAPHPGIAFRMNPERQVHALLELDMLGLDLLAIYHSHPPGSRTDPSETDLREATFPGAYIVIVAPSLKSGVASLRAFTICENRAVEVPIVINSDHSRGEIKV